MNIINSIKHTFKQGNALSRLIMINLAIFTTLKLVVILLTLFNNSGEYIVSFLAVPAYVPSLLHRVWTPITYMFLHEGFMHILFNMFALYSFGSALEHFWGGKKFLFFYISCGLGAALLHTGVNYYFFENGLNTLISNGFTKADILQVLNEGKINTRWQELLTVTEFNEFVGAYFGTVVGASGAIYGLLVAFAFMFPNAELMMMFIPVPIKAKFFVIGYAVIELVSTFSLSDDGVAHIAHLGGMVFGFFLIRYWRKQIGNGYYQSNSADAFDKLKGMFGGKRRAGRTHFTYTKNESYNPTYEQDAECKTNEKVVSQEEIDRILDKIRKSGYDSLTQSEKQMLFDQSNK